MTSQALEFLRNPEADCNSDPDLKDRVPALSSRFEELWGAKPQVCVRSPGRAEILGNHTDYNLGFALSCAISLSTLVALRKRPDRQVRIRSTAFPEDEVLFDTACVAGGAGPFWSNYPRAVAAELLSAGHVLGGADILIDSSVPFSGGVSSSAALEVGVAAGLKALFGLCIDELELALLCRRAENGPLVRVPCGLLDQASVVFAERGKLVLLDFKPRAGAPVGVELVEAGLAARGFSFVIAVDPKVKRNLGDSGYPARRRMCEASCPLLSKILGRSVESLRDISLTDFESCKEELALLGGQTMAQRVRHVVHENQRVLDGVEALKRGDDQAFGSLLTLAGHSALELYGLDENTPELTYLVELGRAAPGSLGSRNMGGGFSAITLSLVVQSAIPEFEEELLRRYKQRFGQNLEFIEFEPAQGASVL